MQAKVTVRPLRETDLPEAKRTFHLAFGTFLALPNPMGFYADRDYVRTRYGADPSAAFGAEADGQLIGSNFAANWGSVGFSPLCHCGANTEAGTDRCYIKFAAVRRGRKAAQSFNRLLDACESFTASRGLRRIEAGVNLARQQAYHQMLGRGFRTLIQGVTVHKPNEPGYSRSGVYVIDDWR
jgi:hypothetical protein